MFCVVVQGIPTLLMAAGSFDDILAITGFSTCLGIAFSTGLYRRTCSILFYSVLFRSFQFYPILFYMLCLSCRFYMDEHTEGSAGGGGRGHSRADPGSVPVLLP